MCIKNFLFPILLFAFKIFCFLSLSCKSGLLLLIYYYFLAILSNVMPDCCIVKFRRKKKYGEDLTKKDLFCLQELFLLLLCFGDSCWLALIKKNFKKINEWNIFIYFFQIEYSWIFLFSMLTRLSLCFLLVNYFLAWCRGFIPATFYPNVNLSTRSFNMFFIYLPQKINLFTRMLLLLPNCFVCYFTYLPADSKLWPRCFFPF